MPPKRRKFESTFPAARIKKIMQLDDDVGRVASAVPVVISRAVEIFLQALLTRAADYAASRNAKTLTVLHLKHCIEQEKQWDFLKELTAKISSVGTEEEREEGGAPRRGRKRRNSQSKAPASTKKRAGTEEERSESEEEEETPPDSSVPTASASGGTQRVPKLQSVSSGSTLPTPQPSATFLPSASVSSSSLASSTAGGGGGGGGETGGLPLSVLAAGLQQTANNQDEGDDDYDE